MMFSVLFLGMCSSVSAQYQTAKIVKFKLEGYGWQPLPQRQSGQHGEHPGTPSHLISIDHNNRVLVGFSARENYSLASREHPGLSFRILRFTPAGKLDLLVALPTKFLQRASGNVDSVWLRWSVYRVALYLQT
jgi:hypothetical protein